MKQNRILVTVIMTFDLLLAAVCIMLYFREDRVQPEFRFQTDESIYNYADGRERLLEHITAFDDRDGDISDRIVIEKITENRENANIVVYYAVSDSAGNVAKISRVFLTDFGEQKSTGQEETEVFGEASSDDAMRVKTLLGTQTEEDEEDGEPNEEEEVDADSEDADQEDEDGGEPAEEEDMQNDLEDTDNEDDGEEGTNGESEDADSENGDRQDDGNNNSPVLTLRTDEVTIDAGASPPWTEIIETLRDDKDNYETLYYNLSVSRFNRNQPGDYPVSLYTEDSEGNRSDTVSVLVHVK